MYKKVGNAMSLMSNIKEDAIKAMKSGDKLRLSTLRSLSAAVSKAETSGKQRKELDDAGVVAVLSQRGENSP